MRIKDLLFGRKDQGDDFDYDANTPLPMLLDLLQTMRAEELMENDPEKRAYLLKQIKEVTKLVAQKTERPERDEWSTEQRNRLDQFSGQRG